MAAQREISEEVRAFYHSGQWHKVREVAMQREAYVCRLCGRAASVCHHIKEVSADNVNDPAITLNLDNLMCLCQACHNRIHGEERRRVTREGLAFDRNGRLVQTLRE